MERKKKTDIKKKHQVKDFLEKEQFKPRSDRTKHRRAIHSVRSPRHKG